MKHPLYTVGLTGGIGSGKSTLAAMLARRGAAVYSADVRAKELMDSDPVLMAGIRALLGECAYVQGRLDRGYVAGKVFADAGLLARLDALVHPAVYRDFEHWRLCAQGPYAVFESAILFESGGDRRCDTTVAVCIPQQVRIERTMARDGLSREQVLARMERQMSDRQRAERADVVVTAVDFPEKECEADRLDALFRLRAREAAR